jgi:hypothetical protein
MSHYRVAWEQLTYSSVASGSTHVNAREIPFTNKFPVKAKAWGLTEADALDVYRHGSVNASLPMLLELYVFWA